MSDWYASESILPPDDLEDSDEGSLGSDEAPLREGLPDTYAMRHDRHYVDELLRGRDETSRDTPLRSDPVSLAPDPGAALTSVLTEVSDGLDAALACWQVSTERPDWSYSATLSRLTQVEVERVKRLADNLRVLTENPTLVRAQVDLSRLVQRVRERTEPERRLTDVTLTGGAVGPGGPAIVIRADQPLLDLAVASWFQGMTALVAASSDPTLHLGITSDASSATLQFSTASPELAEPLAARFFDERYRDRPGAYAAAVALAAAKRIVGLHDGRASVERLAPTGCRVTLTLPR